MFIPVLSLAQGRSIARKVIVKVKGFAASDTTKHYYMSYDRHIPSHTTKHYYTSHDRHI